MTSVGGFPDVGNVDTPWHPQLGVAVVNLGGLLVRWRLVGRGKSSEVSSHHITHPSSDKSSQLRAQMSVDKNLRAESSSDLSVRGQFGGFLHAELNVFIARGACVVFWLDGRRLHFISIAVKWSPSPDFAPAF